MPLSSKTYSALAGLTVSAAWKPIALWVPSQKGLFDEAPQRQSARRGFWLVTLFPAVSKTSTSPSTMYGPFGIGRMVTSAILSSLRFILVKLWPAF
jgi:hypothetical protein